MLHLWNNSSHLKAFYIKLFIRKKKKEKEKKKKKKKKRKRKK